MRALAVALLLAAVLAACARATRPTPPPAVIETERRVYVPIDAAKTQRCSWVKVAAIADIFEVSRGRKLCLEKYEGQFDAIEQVQGAPVP